MPAENLVLRTVYVDPDVDDQLRQEATTEHVSKADLFRRYLNNGIKAVKDQPGLFDAVLTGSGAPLVLRTIYMDPKLDDKLRVEAFDTRTSKNDLMRRYVRVGMQERARTGRPGLSSRTSRGRLQAVAARGRENMG